MDRQATDFALMAGAFSKDEQMARQVCKLLADGDINEATARKMLKLVGDGKLTSEPTACNLQHYPTIWWSYPTYRSGDPYGWYGTTTITCDTSNVSLTAMATNVLSDAA